MVSAIVSAAPSQLYIASVKPSKSLSEAFIIESHPDMAFFPKMADAAAACSSAERPPMRSLKCFMVANRLMDPSSFF